VHAGGDLGEDGSWAGACEGHAYAQEEATEEIAIVGAEEANGGREAWRTGSDAESSCEEDDEAKRCVNAGNLAAGFFT